MQLAAWLLLCFAGSITLRKFPVVLVGIGLGLWVLIPGVAGHIITAQDTSSVAFHPATWWILCSVLAVTIQDPWGMSAELGRHFMVYLLLSLVVVGSIIITRSGTDPGGLVIIVDEILAPILLFMLACVSVALDPRTRIMLRNCLLIFATVESLLAILQWLSGSALFYSSSYLTNYWFNPATWHRWMGTTDHPLQLALLLCVSVPLLAGVRRILIQLPLLALYSVGVMITQSRTGLVALLIGILYVTVRSQIRVGAKFLLGLAVLTGAVAAAMSPLAVGLGDRIANDTGSADARGAAIVFFFNDWTSYFLGGGGIASSFQLSAQSGLQTSLESSILMYAVGIGILFTSVYFGVQFYLVCRYFLVVISSSRMRGVVLSGLFVLVIPQTYSALAVDALAGPLLWFVLALSTTPSDEESFVSGTSIEVEAVPVQALK